MFPTSKAPIWATRSGFGILDLIDALKTGREPSYPARRALQATELIFATYEVEPPARARRSAAGDRRLAADRDAGAGLGLHLDADYSLRQQRYFALFRFRFSLCERKTKIVEIESPLPQAKGHLKARLP